MINKANNAVIGSYKGNPTITLGPEGRYPFTFGLWKAKLILENIEAIKAFVETQPLKVRPVEAQEAQRWLNGVED